MTTCYHKVFVNVDVHVLFHIQICTCRDGFDGSILEVTVQSLCLPFWQADVFCVSPIEIPSYLQFFRMLHHQLTTAVAMLGGQCHHICHGDRNQSISIETSEIKFIFLDKV